MEKIQTYSNNAKYYDLLYNWKNYKDEANKLKIIIENNKKLIGKNLLEIACGTCNYTVFLVDDYNCTGVDLNREMLEIALGKLPKLEFIQADMIDFNLNRKFDLIVCLFSSIAYVKNYENLEKTIKNFASHLNKDGLVIIEPFLSMETFIDGLPSITTFDGDDTKVARLCVGKIVDEVAVLDFIITVAERNKSTFSYSERHELGLFNTNKVLKIMKENGFSDAKFEKDGLTKDRGLYIAHKD